MTTVWPGDVIPEASGLSSAARSRTAPLRLWGADVLVFHELDEVEHKRRLATNAQPLDAFRPLEVLVTLPVRVPVLRVSLTSACWSEISRLPRGAVSADGETVTRLAVRPLRVELVVVRASSWGRGMDLASQFAPFCRRAIFLERVPARASELMMQADFYGVGVFVRGADDVAMEVSPAPYRPRRQTTAAWRFAEEIYRRVSTAEGSDAPHMLPAMAAHCAS